MLIFITNCLIFRIFTVDTLLVNLFELLKLYMFNENQLFLGMTKEGLQSTTGHRAALHNMATVRHAAVLQQGIVFV